MKYDIGTLKRKMLVKYPFFGSVVSSVNYKEDNEIATAETDGKTIYYNPVFLENLSVEEQIFIFAHEVCHIAFNHILRSEGKNMELWNFATDAVINAFLKRDGLKIAEGAIEVEEAINYDAEQLYEKLLNENKQQNQDSQEQDNKQDNDSEQKQTQNSSDQDQQNSQKEQGHENQEQNNKQDNDSQQNSSSQSQQDSQSEQEQEKQNQNQQSSDTSEQKNSQGGFGQNQQNSQKEQGQENQQQNTQESQNEQGQDNRQQNNRGHQENQNQSKDQHNEQKDTDINNTKKKQGHDTHDMWKEAVKRHKEEQQDNKEKESNSNKNSDGDNQKNDKEENEVDKKQKECETLGEKDAFKKNLEEKKKELEQLKNELLNEISQAGSYSNGDIRDIGDIGKSKPMMDWRYILREAIKYDVDWSYKNAYIENGVVSANLEEQPMPETEILLDTSGSISELLLKNFLRECKNILQHSRVKVGCFDTEFYGWHEIRNEKDIENMKFRGGGGTDFDVAVKSFTRRVENKIIFTDGEARMPMMPMDAIWIVFGMEKIDPLGGKVIYITPEQLEKLYPFGADYQYGGYYR